MTILLLTAVLACLGVVTHAVNMFKLSQGVDSTRMTITWSSVNTGNQRSQCKYGIDTTLSMFAEGYADTYSFQSYAAKTGVISGYNVYQSPQFHYVPLAGLLPGTRYFYQCGDFTLSTPDVSAVTSFITSPAVGSATDNYGNYQIFGVYMDSGVNAWASTTLPNTAFSQTQLTANNGQYGKAADHGNVIQAILNNKVSPVTSILHAGDLSYADCNQPMWDAYDLILEPMAKTIPFMASAGNHEQEQSFATGTKTIFTAFEKRYRMPGTPAIFTPNTVTPTGGTNFGSTVANAVGVSPIVSASTAFKTLAGVNPYTTNIAQADKGFGLAATITGSITENGFVCQNSAGGLSVSGAPAFRGNYDYGNSYFSYNSGLAHVIFVNPYVAYEAGSLQYNWLAADLKAVNRAQTPWIIVNTHAPLYNTNLNKHTSDPTNTLNAPWSGVPVEQEEYGMLAAFETVFFKTYNVNFVFSGHGHYYERFTGMFNGAPSATGTVYMTVGTGGSVADFGGFPPYTDTKGIRWTQKGDVDCVNRVTVGTPNTAAQGVDTDCCTNGATSATGQCWPKGTQGAISTTYTAPTAANNYNGLYTETYLQASKFRTDFFYGYGTLALINKDVAQWQFFPVTQVVAATPGSSYQGPISQAIPASFGITAANPSIDFTLICNTNGQYASNICPSSVTAVPTTAGAGPVPAAPVNTVVLTAQRVDGVTAAVAATAGWQLNYCAAQAKVLNVPATSITVTGITTPTSRVRNLLQNSVIVNTAVSSPQSSAAISTAQSAAVASGAFTTALQSQGITGATATVPPASVTPVTPTTTAATATSVASNSVSSSCFAATELLTLESGATKAISEVVVGDRVLTVNAKGEQVYSDVAYLPHGQNTVRASFVTVATEAGRDVKMTANHVLPAGACATSGSLPLVAASAVAAGDCVETVSGRERVVSVSTVEGKGIYTVIAMEELVVVNGVVATPYGGVNPTLANVYYNLHRLAYQVFGAGAMKQWVQAATEMLWGSMSL